VLSGTKVVIYFQLRTTAAFYRPLCVSGQKREEFLSSRTFCSLLLTGALLLPAPVWSQQTSGPKSNLIDPQSGALKLVVLKGEGAMNNIKGRTATQPVVEVRDEQDKPVAGAEVVFQLPAAGPGGVFHGWMRSQTVRTDEQGQATTTGMMPNDEPGRFNIKVTANQGKKTGSVIIAQSNTVAGNGTQVRSGRNKTLWVVLGLAAVGGIAGGVAATRNGSTTAAAASTPISIASGPVTVGGPR
jgi:ribosomal protein L27